MRLRSLLWFFCVTLIALGCDSTLAPSDEVTAGTEEEEDNSPTSLTLRGTLAVSVYVENVGYKSFLIELSDLSTWTPLPSASANPYGPRFAPDGNLYYKDGESKGIPNGALRWLDMSSGADSVIWAHEFGTEMILEPMPYSFLDDPETNRLYLTRTPAGIAGATPAQYVDKDSLVIQRMSFPHRMVFAGRRGPNELVGADFSIGSPDIYLFGNQGEQRRRISLLSRPGTTDQPADYNIRSIQYSAEHDAAVLNLFGGGGAKGARVAIYHFQTDSLQFITDDPKTRNAFYPRWGPDGSVLFVASTPRDYPPDNGYLKLYDPFKGLTSTLLSPSGLTEGTTTGIHFFDINLD